MRVHLLPAEITSAARSNARDEDSVAGTERRHTGSDLGHHTHALVTQDAAVGHRGDVAFQDMEIRSADRGGGDADDCIGRGLEDGLGTFFPHTPTGTVVDQAVHSGAAGWSSRLKGLIWPTPFGNGAVGGESYGLHAESYARRRAASVPFGTDAVLDSDSAFMLLCRLR